MNGEKNLYLIVHVRGISDMCMQSLFECGKGELEKLAQFLKFTVMEFVFKMRTLYSDSISISDKKHVITIRSGRQVKLPKKLCSWLFIYSVIY